MQTLQTPPKGHFYRGCLAGLIAGIAASILMLLLSTTLGGASLPEALGAAIALALPLPIFNYLHDIFGGEAKHYLYYIILIGQCIVFALCGGICSAFIGTTHNPFVVRWRDQEGNIHWSFGVLLALFLWLVSGLIFLPLTGAGIFGALLTIGWINSMLSLAIVGLSFGVAYVRLYNWLTQRNIQKASQEPSIYAEIQAEQRRTFLKGALIALGLGGLGWSAIRFITTGFGSSSTLDPQLQDNIQKTYTEKISPVPQPNYGDIKPVANLSKEITPNNEFYVVSKNFASDPTVAEKGWQLSVEGMVQQPYTLNYQQLMALPMKKQYETLMCISNEVGGTYMGNAYWEGIPLVDLLQKTGSIKSGASKVVLHAADGYTDSIHLSKALEPTTLVAVRMNGETLPQGHGYPARLLVPGIYGMKHVKWITKIEIVDNDFKGYWQKSGWSDPAPVKMTARIDTPGDNQPLKANQQTYIAGIAFSGNKGIAQVEVSTDGGQSWQKAVLKRPLSELTWVIWELPWRPLAGNYTILARAIDRQGNMQTPQIAPPLPDGASGYHYRTVSVS